LSGSHNCAKEVYFFLFLLYGSSHHASNSERTGRQKLNLTAHLLLVPSQKMRGGTPLLKTNGIRYFIVALRKSGLHQFRSVILEVFPSVPTVISPLNPRGDFMYHDVYTPKKCTYCITAYLCVSYDSQNREKIFPYTAIAGALL